VAAGLFVSGAVFLAVGLGAGLLAAAPPAVLGFESTLAVA
jgi:hypothetical protein